MIWRTRWLWIGWGLDLSRGAPFSRDGAHWYALTVVFRPSTDVEIGSLIAGRHFQLLLRLPRLPALRLSTFWVPERTK